MPRVIGIDLGTTNTAVAVVDGGRPRVLEDERGYKVLPSVVSAKGEGRFVVGQAAHNLIITNPDRTVYATKRLIGRRFDSPEVQHVLSRVQYKLRPAADGTVQMLVGDQWMTPIEVAAVILQVARSIAERTLGDTVDDTVITVPAYFNHLQRKATLEAAHLAGLPCERLLNEPTAAALAYGHKKNLDRTMVIFDLGGGTFDVSVLRLSQGIYEILATTGDTFLGGEDFDYRVVDHLADQFQSRTGVDARQDRSALQRLKDAAERAKCELSFSDRAEVLVPHLAPGQTLEAVLARTTLESLTADLIDRCIEIARRAVADAGLSLTDIGDVILVGGQTRMPRVREAVAGLFGREPNRSVHPEEVVAIGAAVHAANLGDGDRAPTVLMDVTPFDVGIDTAGGMFVPVITRNARIPAAETKVFATIADQQEVVRITVRQGDNRTAVQNEFLGEFLMEGLTPAPRLQTKVDVTFRIDSNGMLHVAATERGTGEKKAITIRNYAEHARSPNFPDAEQAKADDVMRRLRAAQGADGGAKGDKARGSKKLGIIDRLLRRGPGKAAAKPASTPAATPVVAATPPDNGAPLEAAAAVAAVVAGGAAVAGGVAAAAAASAATAAAGAAGTAATGAAATAAAGTTAWLGDRGDEASVIEAFSGINSTEAIDDVEDDAALDALLAPPPPVADGVILDALVEPLPDAPLVDATDGLALDVGLAPIEEDAYADEGAFASMGVAGGVGGLADDDPFANLDEPMGDLAAALDSGRDLSELFGEIGIDDVELNGSPGADPFAAAPAAAPPTATPADPFAAAPAAPVAFTADPFGAEADAAFVTDLEPAVPDDLASLGSDLFADLPSPPADAPAPSGTAAAASIVETGFQRIEHAEEPVVALGGAPEWTVDEQDAGPGELLEGEVDVDLGDLDGGLDAFDLSTLDSPPTDEAPFDPFAVPPPAAVEEFDPFGAADLTPVEPDALSLDFEELPELTEDAAPFQTTLASPPAPPEPPEILPDPTDVEASGFALLDPDTNVRAILGVVRTPAPEVETVPGSALDEAAAQALVTVNPGSDVRTAGPDPVPEPPAAPRRPARVKLHYDDPAVLVAECRENVLRGGAFIRTARPLPVGRECVFEIDAPGIPEAIVVPATVTFVASAGPAQESGMGVEYRLGDDDRRRIEQALARV